MPVRSAGDTATPPGLGEATAVFARIGLLSFGGPAGQIALMHRTLVEERRWISDERFLHALNFCMLLPGPEAQQLATYVGWMLHGTRGGLIAGTLFVLPGFLVILALSATYAAFGETHWIDGLFFGLKAAVLAVVLQALLRVAGKALRSTAHLAVAVAAFAALFALAVPFPAVVLAAGLAGVLWPAMQPPPAAAVGGGRAVDPQTSAGRAVRLVAVFGFAWAAPVLVVAAVLGADTVFVPLAVFFSKMAVVTFGGAYAVLSYVAQQAVDAYGWLTPGEMLDGLALAETTPGPLILVLAFVGFLAGYGAPGPLAPMTGGVLAATLTTWVTFVPCFLWILLGAPWMERIRGIRRLSGALAAITAAVVGVIANLALWFALNTLFGSVRTMEAGPLRIALPDPASVDLAAVALVVLAAVALFGLRMGMGLTLAACGAAGIALKLAA